MIKIIFKNLDRSELVVQAVNGRIEPMVEKFASLKNSQLLVTLEMENSPEQAGPDYFKIKLRILGGQHAGLLLEKSAQSLYVALADLTDHLLEAINRRGDKARVLNRNKRRKFRETQGIMVLG
jgi:hypothetical protein